MDTRKPDPGRDSRDTSQNVISTATAELRSEFKIWLGDLYLAVVLIRDYCIVTMERAFMNKDVLHIILSYCFENPKDPVCKSTLASCARVCKLWSPTALDMLWKELDTPWNIFKLLGSYTKTEQEQNFLTVYVSPAWKI